MIDQDIEQHFKELERIFNYEAIHKIKSHVSSLHQNIIELKQSRDGWKKKYEELKAKLKESKT